MNEKYLLLYNKLLEDIERSQAMTLPENENVTVGFWIAHNYWEKLKSIVDSDGFANDNEEIDFFKNVKPSFTSYIEFFTMVSQSLICIPGNHHEIFLYWEQETDRFLRYREKNEDFVRYYETNADYNDSQYFLRRNAGHGYIPKSPVYDIEPEYCTSHDHLVRSYLAGKMYWEYCKKKLETLANKN